MIRSVTFLTGLFAVMILLAACGSVSLPQAAVAPTQTVWKIGYPSELAWMVDDFGACLDANWNVGIVIEETRSLQPQNSMSDILLVWGDLDPQGLSAWQLGTDHWVAVVNSAFGLQQISTSEIKAIYEGDVRDWSQIDNHLTGQINAWVYPNDSALYRQFEAGLGGIDRLSPYLGIAPDVKAMIEAVYTDPSAIGFIPAAWPDSGLNEVNVAGMEDQKTPVVAITKTGDNQQISAWLSCLSDRITK